MGTLNRQQVCDILTVEEWGAFKRFVSTRPQIRAGEYEEHDLHEFMGVMRCKEQS